MSATTNELKTIRPTQASLRRLTSHAPLKVKVPIQMHIKTQNSTDQSHMITNKKTLSMLIGPLKASNRIISSQSIPRVIVGYMNKNTRAQAFLYSIEFELKKKKKTMRSIMSLIGLLKASFPLYQQLNQYQEHSHCEMYR